MIVTSIIRGDMDLGWFVKTDSGLWYRRDKRHDIWLQVVGDKAYWDEVMEADVPAQVRLALRLETAK